MQQGRARIAANAQCWLSGEVERTRPQLVGYGLTDGDQLGRCGSGQLIGAQGLGTLRQLGDEARTLGEISVGWRGGNAHGLSVAWSILQRFRRARSG